MNRVGATQTWPALRNFDAARTLTARSTSASSNTIAGAWPPSSMVTRFMWRPASDASCLPTAVEPVKEIFRIVGVRDQIGADRRRVAEHQIEHAGRQASVGEGGDERSATGGRLLRALEDDRASRRQRGGNLAHRLVDRKIPGRERRDRADRLLDHQLRDVGGSARE